jgi:hypothetical protein
MSQIHGTLGARIVERFRTVLAVYVILIAIGLGAVAVTSNTVYVDAWPKRSETKSHRNLSHLSEGTRITASSFDAAETNSHPLYAIDGDPESKFWWSSAPTDRKPWVSLRFRERVSIDSVSLTFAGPANVSIPEICKMSCNRVEQGHRFTVATQTVTAAQWKQSTIAFSCKEVDELVVAFDLTLANRPKNVVVSELVVMGQEP